MKKIITVLLAVFMFAAMSVQVFAGPNGVIENPPIDMKKITPVIDGNITDDEGWSSPALMNYDTLGFFWHVNPLTMKGNVKFAYDDEYFYYCADIVDGIEAIHEITGETIPAGHNSFIYSTDFDDIDERADGTTFGYNGDVFGMLIDPLETMVYSGFTGNEDDAPCYFVSLFEGDVAAMYKEQINSGEITDEVQVKGHKTAEGWCFEAAIPWDMILADIEDITYGDCVITKEDLFSEGSFLKVAAMYHDRFNDPEAGEVATWGCFVTVPTTMLDGTPGHLGTGTNAMSHGITLNLNIPVSEPDHDDSTSVDPQPTPDDSSSVNADDDGTEAVETEEVIVDVTDEKGNAVTDEAGNKVTQKATQKLPATTKKQNTGASNGIADNAQTLDVMLALSVGALAASAIGFVTAKKKR